MTINQLLPGYFDTERLYDRIEKGARAAGVSVDEFAERQKQSVPAKRFGNEDEFGEACAFLCSAQAGYITGQNLVIDGRPLRRRLVARGGHMAAEGDGAARAAATDGRFQSAPDRSTIPGDALRSALGRMR